MGLWQPFMRQASMAALAAASAASGSTKCNNRRNIGSHCPRLIGKAWLESAAAPPLAAAADSKDVEEPVLHREQFCFQESLGVDCVWGRQSPCQHETERLIHRSWLERCSGRSSRQRVPQSPQHYEPIHCIEFYHEATTGIV